MNRRQMIGGGLALAIIAIAAGFLFLRGETTCPYTDTITAFSDTNQNGVRDDGEPPLSGVSFAVTFGEGRTRAVAGPNGEATFTVEVACSVQTAIIVSTTTPPELQLTTDTSAAITVEDGEVLSAEPLVFGFTEAPSGGGVQNPTE